MFCLGFDSVVHLGLFYWCGKVLLRRYYFWEIQDWYSEIQRMAFGWAVEQERMALGAPRPGSWGWDLAMIFFAHGSSDSSFGELWAIW